jgi:hypothetical protein
VAVLDDEETDPVGDPFEDEVGEATGEEETPEREVEEPEIFLDSGVRCRWCRLP